MRGLQLDACSNTKEPGSTDTPYGPGPVIPSTKNNITIGRSIACLLLLKIINGSIGWGLQSRVVCDGRILSIPLGIPPPTCYAARVDRISAAVSEGSIGRGTLTYRVPGFGSSYVPRAIQVETAA